MWVNELVARLHSAEPILLHPGVATTRIYWPYLLTALFLTAIVFLAKGYGKKKLSITEFLKFSFPKEIYQHKSAQRDYLYFLLNPFVYGLLFLPFVFSAPFVASRTYAFLVHLFGAETLQFTSNFWTNLMVTLVAALFADFAEFLSHYFQHRNAFLWNFHKVHHSAEVLTPITVYRAHPVELFMNANLTSLATGLVFGIFNYFASNPIGTVMILNVNVVIFLFNLVGSNLRHSHVWISYPRFLSYFLISPAQHQIHHSVEKIHLDKNFGSIFSFWDSLFKSLYIPKRQETFSIGLSHQEHREFSGLFRLYLLPFKKNFDLIFHRILATSPLSLRERSATSTDGEGSPSYGKD